MLSLVATNAQTSAQTSAQTPNTQVSAAATARTKPPDVKPSVRMLDILVQVLKVAVARRLGPGEACATMNHLVEDECAACHYMCEKWLLGEGLLFADNPYVRHLAASPSFFHAPLGGIGPEAYEAALRNMRSDFIAFPLTRDLTAASRALTTPSVGWKPLVLEQQGSREENHHGAHLMSASQKAYFQQLNEWDVKLFEAVMHMGGDRARARERE